VAGDRRGGQRFQVGVQLIPIGTTLDTLRAAWRRLDTAGVSSIWLPDHLMSRDLEPTYECWSLLAAMAGDTSHAQIGALVSCNVFRNPEFLAHVAYTVTALSGGRTVLGVGAGWFEPEFLDYGFGRGTMPSRLRRLAEDLPRIRSRLDSLGAGSRDRIPILLGGNGERVSLRLAALHADSVNVRCDPDAFRRKMEILDGYCLQAGRDPRTLVRTVLIQDANLEHVDQYVAGGATHIILSSMPPFCLEPVRRLLALP
jgi:alkanesulfonate monooxygenase SsuD/methylene tetrahydromethanopterin reductase-like flavin-dependent oxidoreductase (luciferase family)